MNCCYGQIYQNTKRQMKQNAITVNFTYIDFLKNDDNRELLTFYK